MPCCRDVKACKEAAGWVGASYAAGFSSSLVACCSGYNHAVLIVYTHSDDKTGNLFFTSYDEESKGPAATPIRSVCMFCTCIHHA